MKNLFFENATNLGVPAGTITRKSQNTDFFEVPLRKYNRRFLEFIMKYCVLRLTVIITNIKKLYTFFIKNEIVFCSFLFVFIVAIFYFLGIGCPTRFLTGIPCPGCGMTRAVIHLAKFDIRGALYYHPLVWTLPIIILLFVYKNKINHILLNALLIVIIALFIVVYIVRIFDVENEVLCIDITNSFIYKIITILKNRRI